MGGKLLQGVDRDTLKFAFKCCAIEVDGVWMPVYKDPITDPGKTSKQGIVYVLLNGNRYETYTKLTLDPVAEDQLIPVFENGDILKKYTLDQIRANALMV